MRIFLSPFDEMGAAVSSEPECTKDWMPFRCTCPVCERKQKEMREPMRDMRRSAHHKIDKAPEMRQCVSCSKEIDRLVVGRWCEQCGSTHRKWRKHRRLPREISNDGLVRQTGSTRRPTPGSATRRYLTICIKTGNGSRKYKTHRLVAETWLPSPDDITKKQIDHKDGDTHNNFVDNLEWVTNSENLKRARAKRKSRPVSVVQIHPDTLVTVATFRTQLAAATAVGVHTRAISLAVENNSKSAGYFWRKVDAEEAS